MAARGSCGGRLLIVLMACAACTGSIQDMPAAGMVTLPVAGSDASSGRGPGANVPGVGASAMLGFGANGITRLSREEYRATLRSLLGVDVASDVELLPADSFTPFDNDYTLQVPSKALVDGLKAVSERALALALADPTSRSLWVGCSPSAAADTKCLTDFIRRFGRRALRRPLTDSEVQAYLRFQPFAVANGDFYTAVSMVARAMLQDLEFVYRVEIGQPVAGRPGLYRLDDWETAARLAYFLWGENPDDALLDQAQNGALRSANDVRAAAERMLGDERGQRRILRFHALWMGYDTLPHSPELNAAMRQETDALVRRVVFQDEQPWLDLFSATETWADAALGAIYALPGTSPSFSWVRYDKPDRRGILSHGSLLSNGYNGTDTSPTRRGKFIQARLACKPIPPPPDDVKADEPPAATGGNDCKFDRYAAHRKEARCSGCHALMDGVGFGLENYDHRGAYREHDTGKPQCAIGGEGNLSGVGAFRGPAQLGALLAQSGDLTSCLIQRVYQLGVGRAPRPTEDAPMLEALEQLGGGPALQLRDLMLDWVSSEGFRNRTVDEL
jgi:Protein of unknown function (DUF1592)/Protein of unknown function (DUF1588)/Protein of unknown function (DUF1595)/Protein of unknown function (DUF1587)